MENLFFVDGPFDIDCRLLGREEKGHGVIILVSQWGSDKTRTNTSCVDALISEV